MNVRNASRVLMIPPLEKQKKKKRTAPYCRVSSGSDNQLHSYAAQIEYYTEYVSNHDDLELVDIYADEGLTGTEMNRREDLNRLLIDCRKGKIDKVLVKSASRLARNTVDSLRIIRDLKLLDVSVRCEKENFDTEDMSSEMLVMLWSNLAQEESMSISRNMRWSYRHRMRSGEFITTFAPYGYDLIDGKQLIPNEYEAEIVKWIFDLYLNGMSTARIARVLGQKEIPPPQYATMWRDTSVQYILKNEKYIGDSLLQKKYNTETLPHRQLRNKGEKDKYYVKNSHPAIIGRTVFGKIQDLIAIRYSDKRLYRQYPLSKMIQCGDCGSMFRRRISKNCYISWVCWKHDREIETCSVPRTSEHDIYQAFTRMINRLKAHCGVILHPALDQLERLRSAVHGNNSGIIELKKQLHELTEKAHKLAELRAKELLDDEVYLKQNNSVNAKRAELSRQLRFALDDDNLQDTINGIADLVQILGKAPRSIQSFDEEIFEETVEKVVIDSGERIRFLLRGGVEITERI